MGASNTCLETDGSACKTQDTARTARLLAQGTRRISCSTVSSPCIAFYLQPLDVAHPRERNIWLISSKVPWIQATVQVCTAPSMATYFITYLLQSFHSSSINIRWSLAPTGLERNLFLLFKLWVKPTSPIWMPPHHRSRSWKINRLSPPQSPASVLRKPTLHGERNSVFEYWQLSFQLPASGFSVMRLTSVRKFLP